MYNEIDKKIIQQNPDGADDKWLGCTDAGKEMAGPFADWLAESIEVQNIIDRGEASDANEAQNLFYCNMADYLKANGNDKAASTLLKYINDKTTDWCLDEERIDYLSSLGYEFVPFGQEISKQQENQQRKKEEPLRE